MYGFSMCNVHAFKYGNCGSEEKKTHLLELITHDPRLFNWNVIDCSHMEGMDNSDGSSIQ